MVDPVDGICFTPVQTNCIDEPLETVGEPIPWCSINYSPWEELLLKVGIVWNG